VYEESDRPHSLMVEHLVYTENAQVRFLVGPCKMVKTGRLHLSSLELDENGLGDFFSPNEVERIETDEYELQLLERKNDRTENYEKF
jgi:hypothetical protein